MNDLYLNLPARRAKWRLSQLYGAGVRPRSVTFGAGRMRAGPLSIEEYQRAWDAMYGQSERVYRQDRAYAKTAGIALIALGASLTSAAFLAPAFLATVLPIALAVGALLIVLRFLSGARYLFSAGRSIKLARHHPDSTRRTVARVIWWMPSAIALLLIVSGLAILFAMAIGGGL